MPSPSELERVRQEEEADQVDETVGKGDYTDQVDDPTGFGDYTDQALSDELLGIHATVPLKRHTANLLIEAANRLRPSHG